MNDITASRSNNNKRYWIAMILLSVFVYHNVSSSNRGCIILVFDDP